MSAAFVAFFGGAVYEAAAVVWVRHSERGQAFRAAFASGVCAACLLAGIGESIRHGGWVSLAFVAGYSVGTFAAVRLR
jgi:preprotein translocase subunit SecE